MFAAQRRLFVAVSHGVGTVTLGAMIAVDKRAGGCGLGLRS
jgi:hypothetical protein